MTEERDRMGINMVDFEFSLGQIVEIVSAATTGAGQLLGKVVHLGYDFGGRFYLVEWWDGRQYRSRWFRERELAELIEPRIDVEVVGEGPVPDAVETLDDGDSAN